MLVKGGPGSDVWPVGAMPLSVPKCFVIVNWALNNKLRWNSNKNSITLIQKKHLKMPSAKCQSCWIGFSVSKITDYQCMSYPFYQIFSLWRCSISVNGASHMLAKTTPVNYDRAHKISFNKNGAKQSICILLGAKLSKELDILMRMLMLMLMRMLMLMLMLILILILIHRLSVFNNEWTVGIKKRNAAHMIAYTDGSYKQDFRGRGYLIIGKYVTLRDTSRVCNIASRY